MNKLLLLSVLIVVVVAPGLAARDHDARRGLKRLLISMSLFGVFYWFTFMFLVPQP
jgi:hypothetical protein